MPMLRRHWCKPTNLFLNQRTFLIVLQHKVKAKPLSEIIRLFLSTPKGTSSLGGFDAPQVDDWDLKKKSR
jgi:hypothetical protein